MKSTLVFLFLWLGIVKLGICQWQTLGLFNNIPTCIWFDSLENRLLIAGNYTYYDSTQIVGCGFLQGDSITPLGCGFEVPCGITIPYNSSAREVTDFERFQGELFVTGVFVKAGGNIVNGIAKWGTNDWEPIGIGLKNFDGSTGVGYNLRVIDNWLYLFGLFDSINGIPANGAARFNGSAWESVFHIPRFGSPSNPNIIMDGCWYQGEFYIGGRFQLNNFRTLVKWNGSTWVPVDQGFIGFAPAVSVLLEYQGKLIVGGHFNRWQNAGSIPGNGITAWDGTNWDTLNGGLYFRAPAGSVFDVIPWRDGLMVSGGFDGMGSIQAKNLAFWNGQQWCGLWDIEDFVAKEIYIFQDTLYLCFASGTPTGTQPYHFLAKWLGGPFLNNCEPVSIEDPLESLSISLYPNPAQEFIQIPLPDAQNIASLILFDPLGRKVMEIPDYKGEKVVVGHLAAGLYFAEMEVGSSKAVVRWVKE